MVRQPVEPATLEALPFFSGLPAATIAAFAQHAAIRNPAKGEAVFTQGDTAQSLFIVLDGWVKLYRVTPEGEEAVIALAGRGEAFGEAAVFGGAGYPFSATAAEAAALVDIPAAVLRAAAQADHNVMARVMDSLSRGMRNLQMEKEHLALMSAPQRVGCLLLQMSAGQAGAGGTFGFPYDKSLAAARLGMKPETFSRALAQLKPLGVAVEGAAVTIDSFARLVGYCCTHCSALPGECTGATGNCDRAGTCPGRKVFNITAPEKNKQT